MRVEDLAIHLDALASPGRPSRTAGLHLTDCLDELERVVDGARGPIDSAWQYAGSVGFVIEDLIADQLARQHLTFQGRPVQMIRGIEQELDGVICSPDGLDSLAPELWECKSTWKKYASSLPEHNVRWMRQVKSYCHLLGVEVCNLVCLYICGNYVPFPAPILTGRRLTFTPAELAENWQMVLSARDNLLRRKGL